VNSIEPETTRIFELSYKRKTGSYLCSSWFVPVDWSRPFVGPAERWIEPRMNELWDYVLVTP
jgi:hypothetical protein